MVGAALRKPQAIAIAIAWGLSLATAGAAAPPALRARVSQTQVGDGEAIELSIRQSGDAPDAAPDLSPLQKDFEVIGTRQSRRLSVVNGAAESSRDWEVTLVPRSAGELTIPAIRAGDASTEPIRISVAAGGPTVAGGRSGVGGVAGGAAGGARAPDIWVEAEVDDASPYVQGQVRYTVRVHDGIGIREGALSDPQASGARFTPLGEERAYERMESGRRYVVHEREYSLAPQTSGDLTIPPVTLQARVAEPRVAGRRGGSVLDELFGDDPDADPFDRVMRGGFPFGASLIDRMMSPGREVRVRSNAVTLKVQARPGEAADEWFLPAQRVELAEAWSPARPTTLRVGEAVSRTISLRALGATAEQLPAFAIPAPDGVRQYDEDTRSSTEPASDGVVAVRQQTVSLVATRAGSLTLPPVEVRWWDVEARQARTASLPARTIEVLPAAGAAAGSQPEPATNAEAAAGPPAEHAATSSDVRSDESTHDSGPPTAAPWPLAGVVVPGAVVAVLAALGATLALRRQRAAAAPTASTGRDSDAKPRRLLDDLRRACQADDARAARDALIRWARAQWPDSPPASSAAVVRRLGHPGVAREVGELEACLYGRTAAAWRGASLWRELEAARSAPAPATDQTGTSRSDVLPALYPKAKVA